MNKILVLFFVLFCALPVNAQDNPYVTLDVFASQSAVEKGEDIQIAIRQNIFDGWHTYWTNAGDSGEPMSITWDFPDDVTIGDIHHPTPKRIYYDPLVNFGHYRQPIFTQTLSVTDDYKGDTLTLNGDAFWLVCDDICIPEEQKVSLTIPIGSGTPTNQGVFDIATLTKPETVNWKSDFYIHNGDAVLTVDIPNDLHNQFTDVEIFPYDWGLILPTSDVMADIADNLITFTASAGDRGLDDIEQTKFVLKTGNDAYLITARTGNVQTQNYNDINLIFILLFAFVGGLILNLMPCVFPVLSMKALSLVKLSDKERSHARKSGLAYTAGIILSFVLIAGTLIALKGAGETIGWGFQLQNPYVVTALATLLFLIGLNLLGLFDISGRFTNIGSKLTTGHDTKSSFFAGVLATLVATPCTAPFMASAIGYALTQSAFVGLLVFAVLGLGLAFPYLLLTYAPAVQRILPRPGAWMDTFKQALSWPMFASAIWLVWVLIQQAGDLAAIYILGLFMAITFIVWFFGKSQSKLWRVIVVAFLAGVFVAYASILSPKTTMNYEPFDKVKLEQILKNDPDQSVFINMTAAWCITCLVNERTSLSQPSVKQAFEDQNILYMKGDWTNRDEKITKYLESHGRNGVPLYVFYGAQGDNGGRPDPVLLPQILTPDIVLSTIKKGD
jgi:thiol:disulfide interchange protein/DsbC/DsbD-like thiol-disulfide interchange protein